MLTLTEAAGAHLATLLDNSEAPDDAAVRIVMGEKGLALATDQPRAEDATYEHNDKTVLVLDKQVATALSDRTIDIEQTEKGTALAIS